MSVNNSEEGRPLLEPDLRSSNDLPSIRKPISPAPGTALSNRWRYYQYLNIDLKNVPRLAASHVLTYDEDADDDAHFGGGENILHPVALSKDDYGKSSLLSALFNLTTTMVGGGTLSLPFAMASAGIVLGVIIVVIVAVFAAVSAHLLVRLSAKCSAPSYKDIAIDAYGVLGAKIVESVIVLFTWGALAAYLVIMGDSIKPILTLAVYGTAQNATLCPLDVHGNEVCPWYFDSRFYILVWMVCLCTPLGLLKKMSALKYTSVGSLTATSYIIVVVLVRSVQFRADPASVVPQLVLFNWDAQLFVSFPILAIAFAFHMNIAPVQMELSNPTQARVVFACVLGVAISTLMYVVMGVFGNLRFGRCVASNVLNSFTDHSDIVVQVGRIAFLAVVTLAFPLIVYPCRMNLRTLFFRTLKRDNWFHIISTLAVIATAYLIAISGVSLGLVFGVLGATCGNFLIYTFPGALYVKLYRDERWFAWRKLYAYFAIGFGVVMMVICMYSTIAYNNFVPPECRKNATNVTAAFF